MKPRTLHKRACKLLGIAPDKIALVGPNEWKERTGGGIGRLLGVASRAERIYYIRRTQGYDTYVHELLHHLFPSRPHWWVFSAAFKLVGVTGGRLAYGMWMTANNIKLESRAKLLRLSHEAAKRKGLA
jgi:hypothetical protein